MISSKVARASALVFYDGECGVCNRYVQWLLEHDVVKQMGFAPLQGRTARFLLGEVGTGSMVLVDPSGTYRGSEAFLRGVLAADPDCAWARAFLWVPRFLRDRGYEFFARNRHHVPAAACRLLNAHERERFFD